MQQLKSNRTVLSRIIVGTLIIMLSSGIIFFNKYFDLEKLKTIHIEKEKSLGEKEVNHRLYLYNDHNGIEKLIITDYQYLWVLPDISHLFRDGIISSLEPSSAELDDDSIGYLLWTPSYDNSKEFPDFIETRINTGQYKEIFNYEGYRFIKIH